MGVARAGQTASQNLQAMQRSSPLLFRRSACSPRESGGSGGFSFGNWTVILRLKAYLPVMARPLNNSNSIKLRKKSLSENGWAALDDERASALVFCADMAITSRC